MITCAGTPNGLAEPAGWKGIMTEHTIFEDKPDRDTLGGRLSRARDATGMSAAQFARRLGVKTQTVQAWENDRSEPRANRLSMVAGLLNVGVPWLLYGVGHAPVDDPRLDAITVIRGQLDKARQAHQEMGTYIERIEEELKRLHRAEN